MIVIGNILSSYIFPHPPIIVPEIGKGEEKNAINTVNGCIKAAEDLSAKNPETIVVITPHGPVFKDAISISIQAKLKGSFRDFMHPEVKLEFENDTELVEKIKEYSLSADIPLVGLDSNLISRFKIDPSLDHGTLVPLYYIAKAVNSCKIVHISIGFLSYSELKKFGTVIKKAVDEIDRNVVIVASGDLSHRLTQDAPCGFNRRGKEFDESLVKLLGEGQFNHILQMKKDLIESAGECGLRPFSIMFGCLEKCTVLPEIISYEGPFGVGYCVAKFEIADSKEGE